MRAGYYVYVFGLQYNKGLRRIGGSDQADIFNLIQNNSQYTGVHLNVDEEPNSSRGPQQ